MRPGKEVLIFVVFAALIGWRVAGLVGGGKTAARGSRRSATLEYEASPVPDTALALPRDRSEPPDRDLFSPPRDTRPLPPLELELPPIEPLAVLAPPTAWGPGPRTMGATLRRPLELAGVAGLFDPPDDDLVALPQAAEEDGDVPGSLDDEELDAAARLERIEALRRQYDWIVVGGLKFGYIRNADRYALRRNLAAIEFSEVDTDTGVERYPGQPPIPYERDRVDEFGFADTPANRIEQRNHDLSGELRPAQFDEVLDFAEECIRLRNEAPRALEIAQAMFERAADLGTDRVRARLGLARCHELGFRFEEALAVYRDLTAGEGATHPEPWARLGDLYALFRLTAKAEEAYREGLRRGPASWEARWRYGRWLAGEGRHAEARNQLGEALQREPNEPGLRVARVAIRSDLAGVLLWLGRLDEARDLFGRARSADPTGDVGLAGLVALSAITGGGLEEEEESGDVEASFDLLLARGLAATHGGDWEAARRYLEEALAADPFRAVLPLRTLSWLAEVTGHPEEALDFVERAHDADPTDLWTLLQRARLYEAEGDLAGAMNDLRAALDGELDFPDALVELGRLSQRLGDHAGAERYYERALALEDGRPVVHSLRGFNHLQLGAVDAAGDDFRAALRLDGSLASAQAGLGWWHYAQGDPTEAVTLLAQLVDRRRNEPEGDLARTWAEEQKERILDHQSKEVWSDRFDRVGRIANNWSYDQGLGAEVRLSDGAVRIEGQLVKDGSTRFLRELPADRFLAIEASVAVAADSSAVSVGIFVARETGTRAGDVRVNAAVALARNAVDGVVQARLVRRGQQEAEVIDMDSTVWPLDQPVRVRLERHGETSTDTAITLWLDDVPVLERIPVQALGRSNQPLRFGVFVEGQSGRRANVAIDDVRVVRRRL